MAARLSKQRQLWLYERERRAGWLARYEEMGRALGNTPLSVEERYTILAYGPPEWWKPPGDHDATVQLTNHARRAYSNRPGKGQPSRVQL